MLHESQAHLPLSVEDHSEAGIWGEAYMESYEA